MKPNQLGMRYTRLKVAVKQASLYQTWSSEDATHCPYPQVPCQLNYATSHTLFQYLQSELARFSVTLDTGCHLLGQIDLWAADLHLDRKLKVQIEFLVLELLGNALLISA